MICPRLRYHICTPAVSGCFRALWLYVRVDFLRVLWWLAEATQTWPHRQHFYGTSCLRLCSPFFLAVLQCFHALPQRFSRCFSQFGLQCEDFLSFPRPFTSFPDSFFFPSQLQKLPILFLILCMSPPPKVPFYFPRFLFSFSLTLSGERSYSAAPGFLWFPCQQVVRQRQEQGAKGERQRDRIRQRERERGFHRLHRTAFVLKSTATIPCTPANGTTQNRNTSQQNTKQLLRLVNIHIV